METTTAPASSFDLSSLRLKGRYVVEMMGDDFHWRTESTFERTPGKLEEVMAVAEKLVDPSTFDPSVESIPREVRISRVGRFLKVPIESTPAVKVAPLQLRECHTGGPDLSPAGKGSDPIPVGQQGWVAVFHFNAHRPSDLVATAERHLCGGAQAARIFREVDGTSYELWSGVARSED